MAADLLDAEWARLITANEADLARARAAGAAPAALDRLSLSEERVHAMATSLRAVAALSNPVGEVVEGWVRPNGLAVTKVRVPLGVIGVIYENRPNVTSDAAGLCLKAGNAAFSAARVRLWPRTRRWWPSCARPARRPASPRTPSPSSRTSRTRPPSNSYKCAA